jgi:hypothetical protein
MLTRTSYVSRLEDVPYDGPGFLILKNWIEPPARPIDVRASPIFNGTVNDRKRRQANINESHDPWALRLFNKIDNETNRTRTDAVLIKSDPGCEAQQPHCDYVPTDGILTASDRTIPLSLIVAIQGGTMLDVWPHSHRVIRGYYNETGIFDLKRQRLTLDAGDAVLFRADLIHAGSPYSTYNERIHVFLDTPTIPRHPNQTWIIGVHGPIEIRRCLSDT